MTKDLHVKYFGAAIWQEEALHVIDLRVGDAAKIRADVDIRKISFATWVVISGYLDIS